MNWQVLIKNEYFQAVGLVVGSFVLAKIFYWVLVRYIRKITQKTESDLDDVILQIVSKPFYLFVILFGVYLGLRSLVVLERFYLWIDRIFFIVSILLISLVVARILSVLITRWLRVQKKFERTPRLITKIITLVIYLIAFLMILDYLNIEISPLVATLGLGGLAVGLALQDTLSNFFAGLHIISDQPVKVGDFIELEGNIAGYVEDIGWRSTRIRTLPNTIVIIPNSKLAESIIINKSLPEEEMSVVVQCGVDYGSDLEKVEKVTIEAAKEVQKTVPGAIKEFEPFIRYHTFGDSNINFSIILRVEKPVDKYSVIHEFIKILKRKYDQENIEISWPVRKIYYGEQNQQR